MRYIKLFLISILVFGVILFFLSLLFPSTTVVSRALNVPGKKKALHHEIPVLYEVAFQDQMSLNKIKKQVDSVMQSGEFVSSAYKLYYSDTLAFTAPFAKNIQQGVALYDLTGDSTAVQVFYRIHVPWYLFWKKFGLMLNEAKYGPSLDSAVVRIRNVHKN